MISLVIFICILAETTSKKLKIKKDKSRNVLFKIEKNKPYNVETGVVYGEKSMIIDEIEYFFEDFKEYSILSPTFSGYYYMNGQKRQVENNEAHNTTLLWKTKVKNFDVTLGTNENSTIEFLDLFDEVNRSTTTTFLSSSIATKWLNTIKGGVHRNLGKAYTTFQDVTDIDVKNMSYSMTYVDETETPLSPYYKSSNYNMKGPAEYQVENIDNYYHGTFDKLLSDNVCAWYRQIDVAIAFDSSFCALAGGNATQSIAKIQNIVSIAANKYKQAGLCMTIKISAIEGHCDPDLDPYVNMSTYSGCDSARNKVGLLYEFVSYWLKYRPHIKRDVAHLFTARSFLDQYTGCSYIGTLCNQTFSYGVDSMIFSEDALMQSVLFAHELGHNCGAWHYMEGSGYIMNSQIDLSPFGFAPETVTQMQEYLSSQHCLATVFY